jgi:polyvinyl alcohol dehydrogenase (cytochrome)
LQNQEEPQRDKETEHDEAEMLRLSRGRVATVMAAVARLLVAGATGAAAVTGPGGPPGQWPMAGQNIDDTHFQAAEHVLSPANVGRLAPRWTLTTAGAISATPTVDHGVVYVPDYGGKLWAVAAGSGKVQWSQDISSYTGVAGDVSRTSPAVYGNELILGDGWILSSGAAGTTGARVFAVDRRTGKPVWSTQVDTDPNAQITGSPVVYGGVAYVGISSKGEGNTQDTFRGAVVALNAATGKLLWKTYTVPSNNGGGDSNKPGYYSGNAVWESSFAVDPARGLLYMTPGTTTACPTGSAPRRSRPGAPRPSLMTMWTRSWPSSSVTARSPGPTTR